jgi:hypothetical protein
MPNKPLTEEELKRWWPFDRLDTELMPKQPKRKQPTPPIQEPEQPNWEEALL